MSKMQNSAIALNSEFYFSETSCHTRVKEPSPSNYLSLAKVNGWIYAFS